MLKLARKITTDDQTLEHDKSRTDNTYFGESDGEIPELVIDMDKYDSQSAEECDDPKSELNIPVKIRWFKGESCPASYKIKSHLQSHIESVHEGKCYPLYIHIYILYQDTS